MEKREKIILLLLSLVIAYGAYVYLFSDSGGVTSMKDLVNMDELNRVKDDVQKKLDENPLSDQERFRLQLAERAWPKDPFYDRTKDVASQDETLDTKWPEDFTPKYTGYISIGDQIFAIINDLEYQEGDELEYPGFYVYEITKNKIVIGQKDENGEIVGQKEVFLEEESL